MTPGEIAHISAELAEIKTDLKDIKKDLREQNGRLRKLEDWKNQMAGFAAGSKWTLVALSATAGIIGGGGIVVLIEGI